MNEIDRYLKDKNVRVWKRVLFSLTLEPDGSWLSAIADRLECSRTQVHKSLKVMEVGKTVENKGKRKKDLENPVVGRPPDIWQITEKGDKDVQFFQRTGTMPRRKGGIW